VRVWTSLRSGVDVQQPPHASDALMALRYQTPSARRSQAENAWTKHHWVDSEGMARSNDRVSDALIIAIMSYVVRHACRNENYAWTPTVALVCQAWDGTLWYIYHEPGCVLTVAPSVPFRPKLCGTKEMIGRLFSLFLTIYMGLQEIKGIGQSSLQYHRIPFKYRTISYNLFL
jgi:hypothetical protein